MYKRQDEHLLRRNTFIGDCYNEFQERKDAPTLLRVMTVSYTHLLPFFSSKKNFFIIGSMPADVPERIDAVSYTHLTGEQMVSSI